MDIYEAIVAARTDHELIMSALARLIWEDDPILAAELDRRASPRLEAVRP